MILAYAIFALLILCPMATAATEGTPRIITVSDLVKPISGSIDFSPIQENSTFGQIGTNISNLPSNFSDEKPQISEMDEGTEFTKADFAAEIMKKGVDLIVIEAADGIASIWKNNTFSMGLQENQDVVNEYGATRGAITTLMVANPHPEEIEPIAKFEKEQVNEWAFLIAVFILTFLLADRAEKSKNTYFQKALVRYDLSESRFVVGVFACIASYGAPRILLFIYWVLSAVSKFTMIEVMDFIEPSAENAWLYFFMMIGETLVGVPFLIRHWVMDLAYAVCRLVVVIFVMGLFQDEILAMWRRFKLILIMQPVCVFVACAIIAIIKAYHAEDSAGLYIILFGMVAYTIKELLLPGKVAAMVDKGVHYGMRYYTGGRYRHVR